MHEAVSVFLLYLTSFFSLINPLGVMPVFLGMTADLSAPQRTRVVKRAVVVAFITLIAFAFLGKFIFLFFNISTDSLRIVGGVIFFLMGYEMLQARLSRIKVTDEEALDAENDISITPLAIPMICGPGAITNAIVLMGDTKGFDQQLLLVFSILVIGLITFIVLLGASRITSFLGATGNKVMMRLMGLIVMVIAVEFFLAGLRPYIESFIRMVHS